MKKRLLPLLLLLTILCLPASAELSWPSSLNPAQERLQTYISQVNDILISQGARPLNQLFELYSGFALLAVTTDENAEIPEDVELSVTMDDVSPELLTLRVSNPDTFVPLAAACIQAAAPSLTWAEAKKDPEDYARRVNKSPEDSFSADVLTLRGLSLRAYYAYAPNEYHDGVNWMTMTLVFPLESEDASGGYVSYTPPPAFIPGSDDSKEYDGYVVGDDYVHFEVIVTETPNPEDGLLGS